MENAFGIFAARFRVFHSNITWKPDSIADGVMLLCVATSSQGYITPQDLEETNRETLLNLQMGNKRNASANPKRVLIFFSIFP